jgi:hypothetical protein
MAYFWSILFFDSSFMQDNFSLSIRVIVRVVEACALWVWDKAAYCASYSIIAWVIMCVQNQSSSTIYVPLLMFHVPRIGLSFEISDSHQTSIFHLLYFCRWDWKLYNTTFWISEHWLVAVVLLGKDREVLRSTDYCWGNWHIYWTCKSIVLTSCWTLSDLPTWSCIWHTCQWVTDYKDSPPSTVQLVK